ncbi:DUF86 domain-containing protein [Thermoanaerobacter sp. CM-CNRG TB177]|jgi:uncharacterized protein YutE (UPF0331/DUF86 family)|uniref:type VII toxin-antitoxin system HepT family RNase toxin n=1 Tax=unclassified Thermoanaerobacter TaxID=2636821 RepID=UPI0000E1D972|nr:MULTISPECIES: DUF86 domain-containing protein [unclassified Thermoanaerobacter]KUJ90956.1 MAG: hypothetical protein XD37_0810 [Thermoanaerobacter thermocopriae]KUK35450.1 MAG: hypothetical protein XD65_0213 [Caldanaerobacter subterraneus]MBZ4656124.1 hypothetical protein [Thermoanaerobacter sp.]ABY91705.1 protein of unknown function DUF86 [Thermoanaerobacter sp. X514]MBT1278724.1 DUF86 domain-containing protein [Thermoanaerobacter sp. CM-CNRG TB177]
MINSQLILERLILISEYLEELKVLSSMDKATFLSDKRNSAAAESFLRRTLEAIFDIGRHILAKAGNIELSKEYKSIARGLGEYGYIDEELSKKLVKMAGYRNRMVHLYNLVTDEELYEIITSNLKDIEEFVSEIKKKVLKRE